jgi:hypothetical protein
MIAGNTFDDLEHLNALLPTNGEVSLDETVRVNAEERWYSLKLLTKIVEEVPYNKTLQNLRKMFFAAAVGID